MRTLPAYVFGAVGLLLVPAGSWLLVTGRNFPGILGRGFTVGDNLRAKRAPAEYWRVGGAIVLLTGVFGVGVGSFMATHPAPSRDSVILVLLLCAGFLFAFAPLLARFIVLAAKYRLFRWNEP